jgi:hypothetical protein
MRRMADGECRRSPAVVPILTTTIDFVLHRRGNLVADRSGVQLSSECYATDVMDQYPHLARVCWSSGRSELPTPDSRKSSR